MATSAIGNLGEFNPKTEQIETYLSRLDIWLRANKIPDEQKIVTMLAVVGAEAFEVLHSACYPDDPARKTSDELKDILKNYYHTPKNVISERINFRARAQQDQETISEFCLALKRLSMVCEFGETLDDNLKEVFTAGLKDSSIKNKLLTSDLSWAQMQSQAIAMEQVRRDTQSSNSTVNKITHHRHASHSRGRGQMRAYNPSPESCGRCRGPHSSFTCPYKNAYCHACQKKGHIKYACRNRSNNSQHSQQFQRGNCRSSRSRGRSSGHGRGNSVRQVTEYEQEETEEETESFNLYSIAAVSTDEKSFFEVDVQVEGQQMKFAVDTQASVSVISVDVYKEYLSQCQLNPARGILKSYSDHKIPVKGEITVTVEYNDQRAENLPLVVVEGHRQSLLGRTWLKKLKLDWPKLFQAFSVTDRDKQSIEAVLKKHSSVFNRGQEHNTIKGFTVDLKLKKDAQPVFSKARPVPYALREAVEKNLKKAVDEGILEPVRTSKWASPVVVAPKADKSIRICGDYKRTVNLQLDDEVYPLPTAQDLFSTLAGGTVFTKLDLSNAYQQIPLSDEAKEVLTINTHKGLFRYKRLPYGVKVAPAIFQATMDQILSGFSGVCCLIDDILITSKDMGSHVQILDKVLSRLSEYGVLVNRSKCDFAVSTVTYLGHIISGEGIRPSCEKISAIQAIGRPQNVAELKTFLGAVTYYHRFLPRFASICAPLYHLTKADVKWRWTPECETAVQQVKSMLSSDLVLMHYDSSHPLKLATDASPHGVGAVLSQEDTSGVERPVAYASRTLTSAEKNYSQLEREAVGIMFGIKRFHKYVYGRHFVLVTDNKPLTSIFSPSKDVPTLSALRLQRWALVLMAHNYTIEYRRSEDNANVDMLSRFPQANPAEEAVELPINHFTWVDDLPVITCEDVKRETVKDATLSKVMRYVMDGWPSRVTDEELKPYAQRKLELSVESGCVIWGMRVVVPTGLRKQIIEELHHEHMGVVKMKMLARSYFWFPRIDKEIEDIAKSCEACALHAQQPPSSPVISWPSTLRPMERVHIDFGTIENKDLLIMVDTYSKWIEVAIMSSTTAFNTIQVLRSWFARLGLPRELVSDNGPQFTSFEFKSFLHRNGIQQTLIPPYSPRTNGAAEKCVQIVKQALKKKLTASVRTGQQKLSMQQRLDDFLLTYRVTSTTSTGRAPDELMLGRKLRTRFTLMRPSEEFKKSGTVQHPIREFEEGALVWVRNLIGLDKWKEGQILRKEGILKYLVHTDGRNRLVHVDHLLRRSEGQVQPTRAATQLSSDQELTRRSLTLDQLIQPSVRSEDLNKTQSDGSEVSTSQESVVVDPELSVPSNDIPVLPSYRRSTRQSKQPERLIEVM